MIRRNILSDPAVAQQFVDGISALKDPARYPWQEGLAIYDFFVFWHHRAMMLSTPPSQSLRNAAHSGPVFLPWHRYMLLMLESYLRDALDDDQFRIPYWDTAGDAERTDPTASPIWSNAILGSFLAASWRVRLGPNPTGRNPRRTNRTLRRNLNREGRLATRAEVRTLVRDETVYDTPGWDRSVGGLRCRLEGWPAPGHHNAVHVWVGGDMQESTSPNDPAFYLHHCNVDRIWAAWQQEHPSAPYAPDQSVSDELRFHRVDDPMHTFFDHGDVTPRMMLDVSSSYRYDTFADLL